MKKKYWSELKTIDFNGNMKNYIAVLPLCATEQHGPHLPLGTDMFIAEGLVERTIQKLKNNDKIIFLPIQNIGVSNEHQDFKGTLSIQWETAGRIWREIAECVHKTGIRKMIVITSHGGNVQMMELVARELRAKYNMKIVCTQWGKLGGDRKNEIDIHGGEIETSLMLAMKPELVEMKKTKNFKSKQTKMKKENKILGYHSSVANMNWFAQDLNKEGVVGNAKSASEKIGEKIIEKCVNGFTQLIKEFGKIK